MSRSTQQQVTEVVIKGVEQIRFSTALPWLIQSEGKFKQYADEVTALVSGLSQRVGGVVTSIFEVRQDLAAFLKVAPHAMTLAKEHASLHARQAVLSQKFSRRLALGSIGLAMIGAPFSVLAPGSCLVGVGQALITFKLVKQFVSENKGLHAAEVDAAKNKQILEQEEKLVKIIDAIDRIEVMLSALKEDALLGVHTVDRALKHIYMHNAQLRKSGTLLQAKQAGENQVDIMHLEQNKKSFEQLAGHLAMSKDICEHFTAVAKYAENESQTYFSRVQQTKEMLNQKSMVLATSTNAPGTSAYVHAKFKQQLSLGFSQGWSSNQVAATTRVSSLRHTDVGINEAMAIHYLYPSLRDHGYCDRAVLLAGNYAHKKVPLASARIYAEHRVMRYLDAVLKDNAEVLSPLYCMAVEEYRLIQECDYVKAQADVVLSPKEILAHVLKGRHEYFAAPGQSLFYAYRQGLNLESEDAFDAAEKSVLDLYMNNIDWGVMRTQKFSDAMDTISQGFILPISDSENYRYLKALMNPGEKVTRFSCARDQFLYADKESMCFVSQVVLMPPCLLSITEREKNGRMERNAWHVLELGMHAQTRFERLSQDVLSVVDQFQQMRLETTALLQSIESSHLPEKNTLLKVLGVYLKRGQEMEKLIGELSGSPIDSPWLYNFKCQALLEESRQISYEIDQIKTRIVNDYWVQVAKSVAVEQNDLEQFVALKQSVIRQALGGDLIDIERHLFLVDDMVQEMRNDYLFTQSQGQAAGSLSSKVRLEERLHKLSLLALEVKKSFLMQVEAQVAKEVNGLTTVSGPDILGLINTISALNARSLRVACTDDPEGVLQASIIINGFKERLLVALQHPEPLKVFADVQQAISQYIANAKKVQLGYAQAGEGYKDHLKVALAMSQKLIRMSLDLEESFDMLATQFKIDAQKEVQHYARPRHSVAVTIDPLEVSLNSSQPSTVATPVRLAEAANSAVSVDVKLPVRDDVLDQRELRAAL